jgi:hypothetical protein
VVAVEDKVREAYALLVALTRRYAEARASARRARAVIAPLAMALFREGLPMTAAAQLARAHLRPGPGGYLVLPLLRPGAVVHEYIVTPSGLDEVRRLLQEARSQYATELSMVRSLHYESNNFRKVYGLRVTPLDAYALKLYSLNLLQHLKGKYSAERLGFVVEHLLSRKALLAATP